MCVPICECYKSIKLNTDIQVISGHSSVMKLTYYLELETVCFNVSCAPNLKTVKTKQTLTSDNKINCYANFLSVLLQSERAV